jgi:DNA-binding NarL/FixJ family response regulator
MLFSLVVLTLIKENRMNHTELSNLFGMKPQEAWAKLEKLTQREREVAELMALGLSNTGIAEKLSISRKTLDIHRSRVKEKMDTTIQGIGRIWFLAKLAEKNGNG